MSNAAGVKPHMNFFRKKDVDNIEPLVAIINSAYRGVDGSGRWTTENHLVQGDRIDFDGLASLILDEDVDFIVGDIDGKSVACITLKRYAGCVEFGTFAVDPELHGKGYGGELLSYAELIAADYSALFQVSVVSKNKDLIAFYKRRSYRETGEKAVYPVDLNVGKPKVDNIDLTLLQKSAIF